MSLQYYIPTLTDQLTALHKIITQMQTDLQQYQQKNGQNKYTYFKQQQIKIMLNVYGELETMANLMLKDKAFTADDTIFKLEGICLLHGISDLNLWYNTRTIDIAKQVKKAYGENWRQTPFDLLPGNKLNAITTTTKPVLDWSNYKK